MSRQRKREEQLVAAAARTQLYSDLFVCPERCHAPDSPQNAAERSWGCTLCGTTPAPHTVHCNCPPSRICRHLPCHLVKVLSTISPSLPLSLPALERKQASDKFSNKSQEQGGRLDGCCTFAGP